MFVSWCMGPGGLALLLSRVQAPGLRDGITALRAVHEHRLKEIVVLANSFFPPSLFYSQFLQAEEDRGRKTELNGKNNILICF